jgi:hypothetical protein
VRKPPGLASGGPRLAAILAITGPGEMRLRGLEPPRA